MTDPGEDLLTTTEGVDEGSAASTVEGSARPGEASPGDGDPEAAGLGHETDHHRTGGTHGDAASRPAPPYAVESEESRAARAADTGQQLSAGEG